MTDFLTTERLLVAAEKLLPGAAEAAEQAGCIFRSLAMELRGFTPAATIEEAAANRSVTGAAHLAEEAYSPVAHSPIDLGPPFVPRTGTVADADLPKVWSWGSY